MRWPLVLIIQASASDPIHVVNEARMTSALDAEIADEKYAGEAISYVSDITKKESGVSMNVKVMQIGVLTDDWFDQRKRIAYPPEVMALSNKT